MTHPTPSPLNDHTSQSSSVRKNTHGQQHGDLAQHQATSNVAQSCHQRTNELRETIHNSHLQRPPFFREARLEGSPNIVIFGETGTGKSSLINMLSSEEAATVSNLAVGCTFESAPFAVHINGKLYTLWDTAGLNEGDAGSVPADQALYHLRNLINNLKDGISLLVYCIRGSRYRDIIKVNHDLFTEIICQGEVPVIVVITGLENEERMEDWWDASATEFSSRGMHFQGHACITTTKGKRNMFEVEYEESKHTVRTLIEESCPGSTWVVDSDQWFDRVTNRILEYWKDYNGYTHHIHRPEGEGGRREGEGGRGGTKSVFGAVGVFFLSLWQIISAS